MGKNTFTRNDLPLLCASKWNIASTAKFSSWGGFQNSAIWNTAIFYFFLPLILTILSFTFCFEYPFCRTKF